MLLNLNHKTLTAKKLILEKKKNLQPKKNNCQLCKKRTHVLQHTLCNIIDHYVVRLQSLKPVVSTLIQYLLDGDTFIIRIQCSVLEVP